MTSNELREKSKIMAKQCGPLLFEGSLGNLTGYQLNGKFYLRKKGGVSRKRILTSDRFENTRRNAGYFARAQKLASGIYREIKSQKAKGKSQNCQLAVGSSQLAVYPTKSTWYVLRNRAQELLRKEMAEAEVVSILKKEFLVQSCNRQSAVGSRQSAVGSQTKIPDEIFLGRTINPDVVPKILDQLAATTALINNLVRSKNDPVSLFAKEKAGMEFVLKKFRYG